MAFVHFNMQPAEFIEQLRYGAIKSGGSPQLVDQIDALHDILNLEAENEQVREECQETEKARNQIAEELFDLLKLLPVPTGIREKAQISLCLSALERHQIYSEVYIGELRDRLLP